jgi:peptide/nickel transport system substrate-binding protein
MDPQLAVGITIQFHWLYDTFFRFRYDADTKKLMLDPELVEAFDRPDPLTLVYKLRKGVKFHDGTEWNADVAKWNLDRMMKHPKSKKDETRSIKEVQIADNYTIKLILKAPSASEMVNTMLSQGTHCGSCVISKAASEKMGDDAFATNPVGSGPMKFAEWLKSDHITMQRWDNYWMMGEDGKSLPYIDSTIVRFIPNAATLFVEMRTGNLDLTTGATSILATDLELARKNPDFVIDELPWSGGARAVGMNPDKPPFAGNLKLRQAVMYGIDRETMAKTLQPGMGGPYPYLWSRYQVGADQNVPHYEYDLTKAKQLMTEAGKPNGVDATLTFPNRVLDNQVGQVLQQMLKAIGVNLTLEAIERTAWVQKGALGNLEATIFNHVMYKEADENSMGFASDGAANWVARKNPEMDKCLDEGRSTMEQAKRAEIYKRCQTILYEEAVYSTMFGYPGMNIYRKEVKGVVGSFDALNRNWIWLDR